MREALAAGMAVVATAAGGLPDLAGHQRLTLVAPENPSALAAQIGLAMTGRCYDASICAHSSADNGPPVFRVRLTY